MYVVSVTKIVRNIYMYIHNIYIRPNANVTVFITDVVIHPSRHPPPTHLYVLLHVLMMDVCPLDEPHVISRIMFAC